MAILTGFLATFIVGGLDTLNGDLAVGAYGVLVFLTQRLLWPFRDLANTMDLYERGMASARRILGLLDEPIHIKDHAQTQAVDLAGKLAVSQVTFHYPTQSEAALKNINLDIKAGETIAFVGQTGSGKSTLIKLLMRYYHAQQGQITLDDHDITDISIESLRSQIGLVSQATFLFNASIFDNIQYGNDQATESAVIAAAQLAEAHDFILDLDQGYQTPVGEQGVKLSGGQIQRIALARALLKNPPILILDEATSALDTESERKIQAALDRLMQNRTTIVIAHRLSTIENADVIVVMEQGEIIEQGSHEALLEKNGAYAKLHAMQFGEEPAED